MLSGFFKRRQQSFASQEAKEHSPEPPVAHLPEVDSEYRLKAAADKLKKIAPKRFNPGRIAWLPVLHTEIGDWSFTAMFSNTARAHELEKTDDWVVIFYEKNGFEGQSTLGTEANGTMIGKRIVRGREPECRDFFSKISPLK
jgi:DNA polymerase (family 10)